MKCSDFTTLWVALKSHHHTEADAFLLYRNTSVCRNRPVLPRVCQILSHMVQNWPEVTEFHLKLHWYQKMAQGPGQGILRSSLWSAVLSGVYFSLSRPKDSKSFLPIPFQRWWQCFELLQHFLWGSFHELWTEELIWGRRYSWMCPTLYWTWNHVQCLKIKVSKCSHLAHHPGTDQSQQIAAERLYPTTQLWTQPLKANWRNVNIVLMQSLRRYLEKCIF